MNQAFCLLRDMSESLKKPGKEGNKAHNNELCYVAGKIIMMMILCSTHFQKGAHKKMSPPLGNEFSACSAVKCRMDGAGTHLLTATFLMNGRRIIINARTMNKVVHYFSLVLRWSQSRITGFSLLLEMVVNIVTIKDKCPE